MMLRCARPVDPGRIAAPYRTRQPLADSAAAIDIASAEVLITRISQATSLASTGPLVSIVIRDF
jgi:hypothetical protein